MTKFIDTVPTLSDERAVEINEFIQFFEFDSRDFDLFLVSRDAPTPTEKEIVEDVPFMQGQYDFSNILGEKIFHNRKITYEFHLFNEYYENRKALEIGIKRKLIMNTVGRLDDTHDRTYHWMGKCKSVTVNDDAKNRKLVIKVEFDCYPFMIANDIEFCDEFNHFFFPDDYAQKTKFSVIGSAEVDIYNGGDYSVELTVVCSAEMSIKLNGVTFSLKKGENKLLTRMYVGSNKITVSGTGTIDFQFYREVMG